MIGANVNKLRAWEGHQWCYSRRFTAPKLSEGQRAELWFGGIDCLADIWVNGKHAGSSADMLIERRFDVTDLIEQGGENTVPGDHPPGRARVAGPFARHVQHG